LTEYGVPDDEMSDSLPPDGDPDPYDGWDLEGLLSGDSVWLPDGMRPVAATLAALRGAPMRAELDGEAAARASFRRVMLAAGNGAGRAVNGHTLILPADGGPPPHVVTRPRHAHRRPPRRPGWTGRAMAGVAAGTAAVMVVGGIALAGGFSSAGPGPGQPGQSASAANSTTRGGSQAGGSGLAGSATKEPTPSPTNTASASTPNRSTLCRQYWTFFSHHESRSDWAAEKGNLRQLSMMAGGMWNINDYCAGYVQWGAAPPPAGAGSSGNQGPSGQQNPGDSQANNQPAPSAPGNDNAGKGNSGNDNGKGNQGNGNGNGKGNGKGNGNQR
jgi:hypothetical protein